MSTAPLPLSAFTDVLPRYSRELREEIARTGPGWSDSMIEPGTTRRTVKPTLGARPNIPAPPTGSIRAGQDARMAEHVEQLRRGLTLDVVVVSVYTGTHIRHGWGSDHPTRNYAVTVLHPDSGETIATTYSEGTAHRAGFPDAADIVASLLNDASSVLPYLELRPGRRADDPQTYRAAYDGSWRDWADDMGAEHTDELRQAFRACAKTATRLRLMLGDTFDRAIEIAGEL